MIEIAHHAFVNIQKLHQNQPYMQKLRKYEMNPAQNVSSNGERAEGFPIKSKLSKAIRNR